MSTASDIALLYQAFLDNPDGFWLPDCLAAGTSRVCNTLLDPWLNVAANRSFGLTIAGDDGHANLRQFGSAVGPAAFGASGIGGQIAWADPASGLSFCFLTAGLDQDLVAAFSRADRLSTAAARCAPPG